MGLVGMGTGGLKMSPTAIRDFRVSTNQKLDLTLLMKGDNFAANFLHFQTFFDYSRIYNKCEGKLENL